MVRCEQTVQRAEWYDVNRLYSLLGNDDDDDDNNNNNNILQR
jgi:hypothetical protein